MWTTLFYFLKNEHDSAERAAIQNSTNLAGAFEEHLSQSLSEIDRSLKIIRTLYVRDPNKFDLVDWLKSNRILTDGILQITIFGRDGTVKSSSAESATRTPQNFHNGDYYRAHVNAPGDLLIIGKPFIDQATGKRSLQLSRRIGSRTGSFDGVVVATLDPTYLTRIYNSVNIGEHGYIRVIGLDGVVRATSGLTLSALGKDFSGADLFKKHAINGWFYTTAFGIGWASYCL